eukprot:354727-Chlamydomonas_euryale.AAC.8
MEPQPLASPSSPHFCGSGFGRRHSPWTATRHRKKGRQASSDSHPPAPEDHPPLPVCLSGDEDSANEGEVQSAEGGGARWGGRRAGRGARVVSALKHLSVQKMGVEVAPAPWTGSPGRAVARHRAASTSS